MRPLLEWTRRLGGAALLGALVVGCSGSPDPLPSPTDSETGTPFPGETPTATPGGTPTVDPGDTPTPTVDPGDTPTPTVDPGDTPTATPEVTPTQGPTPTPLPDILLSAPALDFESVTVGEAQTRELSIENQGGESLFLTLTLPSNPAGQFSLMGEGGALPDSLDAGASVTLTLTFTPSREGDASGILRIDTNSRTTPRTDVTLSGRGIAPSGEDADGDGYSTLGGDCDDGDAAIYPGAVDGCDGIDNDCDTEVDEEGDPYYRDADGDGFGTQDLSVSTNVIRACLGEGEAPPTGYVGNSEDCDDLRSATYPGAPEACDGRDNDCDTVVDESTGGTFYADADGDGYGDDGRTATGCAAPEGYVSAGGDCDDTDPERSPDADEACDGEDDDCDGETDEGVLTAFYLDGDGDGFGDDGESQLACAAPEGYVAEGGDCDDGDGSAYPEAGETCDDVDNDCDGQADEGLGQTFYGDSDGDGFGDGDAPVFTCSPEGGLVADGSDCDDGDAAVNPGATESCDEVDNDCDGAVDESGESRFYRDGDGDGFGDSDDTYVGCGADEGYVARGGDCDDGDGAVYPGAAEACDGGDDDCDGAIDEGAELTFYLDADRDGYGNTGESVSGCQAPSASYSAESGDCDDLDAEINPGASELCDGVDGDCDGSIDEGVTEALFVDGDGDGFGNPSRPQAACEGAEGLVDNDEDCADDRVDTYPGAEERCDGVDNDCDTRSDEGVKETFYGDADDDGYGVLSVTVQGCSPPAGFAAVSGDCDDGDAGVNPGAAELCNGADEDCDRLADEGVKTTYYADGDRDGYGVDNDTLEACSKPTFYVLVGGDCDDTDGGIYPSAVEACDGADNDCDLNIDEGTLDDYYVDEDGDGYGDSAQPIPACAVDEGVASEGGDCDDGDSLTFPGAEEICDGADNDCDRIVDEDATLGFYADRDGDGYGDPNAPVAACEAGPGRVADDTDCDDGRADTYPGARELCDGRDNSCNGVIDEGVKDTFYGDADGDGYGTQTYTVRACEPPEGFAEEAGDCNDDSGTIYPGAPELCDFSDNDCDQAVDEGGEDVQELFYYDGDGDGFGKGDESVYACEVPEGYADADGDCDDGDPQTYPEAPELCDGRDNDCDGVIPDSEIPDPEGQRPCAGGCVPGSLSLERTLNLPSEFSKAYQNFSPQGISISHTGQLAYIQQSSNDIRLGRIDNGSYTGAIALSLNHTTGIAWDDVTQTYFVSDYTGNSSYPDLYQVTTAGVRSQASTEIAAYGGYPLAAGEGILYRGELSSTYSWAAVNQIRISTTAAPDSIYRTLTVNIAEGIGDMAWDGDGLWLLAYNADYAGSDTPVTLYRIDVETGAILGTYRNVANSGSGRKAAGVAYQDGKLYVFNWSNGGTSTLMTFNANCAQ